MLIRGTDLNRVVDICATMRKRAQGSGSSSWRGYYAEGFFDKATLHGQSMCLLLNTYKEGRSELDIGGLCALSRCILEIHNASSYLFEPGLSKKEAELRHQLFLLNHATDLKKISAGFGISESDDRMFMQEHSRRWSEDELLKNPIFQALDEPHRKMLLKGKSPYLTARYGGKKPLPKPIESAAYNLFSHSVHSFSLGLSPMTGGQHTPAGGVHMVYLAVEFALIHLGAIALRYWGLRSRAVKKLSIEEKRVLQDAASADVLEKWLSNMRVSGAI